MKKFLFLALIICLSAVASFAQNTMTTAAYTPWNLDTTLFTGTTSGGIATGFSKSFTLGSNMAAIIQVKLINRSTEALASGSIKLWGSMDNSSWVAVPLSSAASSTSIGRSGSYTFGGTYPAVTVPTTTAAQAIAAVPIVADTVALGAVPAASAAFDYVLAINNPLYNYYRLSYTAAGAATSTEKKMSFFARYYLRKPY